jgi:DNA-binding NtrC family response regulator
MSSSNTGERPEDHATPATVLVVDDEVLIRLAVSDFLREHGYQVVEATNGEEAQAIFAVGEPIDLLFSDINLGRGANGFALSAWVRQNHPRVHIVLTSGHASSAVEASDLGYVAFLAKPYVCAEVADRIHCLLLRSPESLDQTDSAPGASRRSGQAHTVQSRRTRSVVVVST